MFRYVPPFQAGQLYAICVAIWAIFDSVFGLPAYIFIFAGFCYFKNLIVLRKIKNSVDDIDLNSFGLTPGEKMMFAQYPARVLYPLRSISKAVFLVTISVLDFVLALFCLYRQLYLEMGVLILSLVSCLMLSGSFDPLNGLASKAKKTGLQEDVNDVNDLVEAIKKINRIGEYSESEKLS